MQRKRIAVLVSGGGTNLQALIDAVKNNYINGEIVLVISDRSKVYALQRAKDNGIEVVVVDRKNFSDRPQFCEEINKNLQRAKAELIVLAGFLSIFTEEFVQVHEGKIINIHPSLIPAFCGKGFYGERVHKAVLDYGAKVSGATVHFVDEGTDSGAIILQEAVPVFYEDNVDTLAARVLKLEHKLLTEAVRLLCEDRIVVDGRRVRII